MLAYANVLGMACKAHYPVTHTEIKSFRVRLSLHVHQTLYIFGPFRRQLIIYQNFRC